jgi:hypothetical protein
MSSYEVVLFLHVLAAIAAFVLAGAHHAAEYLVRSATTVGQLRQLARVHRTGPLFAVLVVLLFVLGAWLLGISDEAFSFGDGWVWTAIVALVVLFADGPAVMAPHGKAYGQALAQAQEGPITPELRAQATAPAVWAVGHMNTFLALGVVLNMLAKPSAAVCAVVLVVAAGLGAALGLRLRGWALAGPTAAASA